MNVGSRLDSSLLGVACVALWTVAACGARTSPLQRDDVFSFDAAGDVAAFDEGGDVVPNESGADVGSVCQPPARVPRCRDVSFVHATQASCSIAVREPCTVWAEGFQPAAIGGTSRVLTFGAFGRGRLLAFCDGTSFARLLDRFDARRFLGGTSSARVAAFGQRTLCGGIAASLPTWLTYLGEDLPPRYRGDPSGLRRDWDALVHCGFQIPSASDWRSEIPTFASTLGGGFMAVMEYFPAADRSSFARINDWLAPTGVVFEPTRVDASTLMFSECVPGA